MRLVRLLLAELGFFVLLLVLLVPLFLALFAMLLGGAADCMMDLCRAVQRWLLRQQGGE